MHYFSLFLKYLQNPELVFRVFGGQLQISGENRENFEGFWWKFNRKFEFLTSFEKSVAKNGPFGNGVVFLQFYEKQS